MTAHEGGWRVPCWLMGESESEFSEIFGEEKDSQGGGFFLRLVFLGEGSPAITRARRVLSGITIYSFLLSLSTPLLVELLCFDDY